MPVVVRLALWGLPLHAPYTSKMKARTRFREIRAQTYPHVAEYYLSHFFDRPEDSFLVYAVVSSSHHPIHIEHKRREVTLQLKASLKIFSLLALLVLRQDFLWVSCIIGV